jgi:ATP-binding cassette, subfamily C, bacterial LapB
MSELLTSAPSADGAASPAGGAAAPGNDAAAASQPLRQEKVRDVLRRGWQVLKKFVTDPAPSEIRGRNPETGSTAINWEKDWLHALMLSVRPAYKQALIVSFFVNLLALASSMFSMNVYDKVVFHSGLYTLAALVIGMLFVMFFEHVLRSVRAELLQQTGVRLEVEIGRRLFGRFLALPTLTLESRPASFWQSLFRDVELVRSTCSGANALLLIDLPFTLLSLAVIAVIALPLLPVILVFAAGFMFLAWRSGAVLRDSSGVEREKGLNRDALLAEIATMRTTVKAQGFDSAINLRWEARYAEWLEESAQRSHKGDHFRDLAHGLTMASTVVMTSVGALAILGHDMTMGSLIAANILSGRIMSPLTQLVSQWRLFGQFFQARKRLDAVFAMPVERANSAVQLPRPKGIVVLDGVRFRFPKSEHDLIHPISGQIGPNGLHAVIGANGSGKSTLLKIMRGLYAPLEGRVLVDGADIAQFARRDLVRWIGYLPQYVQLLSGSVRDNLTLGADAVSDEQIVAAAKLAQVHDFIVARPEGYGTSVGEQGAQLSGGERKRVAIAQALIHDPPILLLDEPTSDLDRMSELAFCRTLRQLAVDHTVIVVTHSPEVLDICDGIIVLDKGRMVAAGPAADILPKLGMQPRKEKRMVAHGDA